MHALLLTLSAHAGDRHVLRDTNDDGILDDCPNPAHNHTGTADSTASLQWCDGESESGKLLGSVSGTTTSSACSSAGGAVVDLRTGDEVDIDGDGTTEPVYGTPQACVWNMGTSDSCEVHAGLYDDPGATCESDCGDGSYGGYECSDWRCWQASIVAFGHGPNLDASGDYGTASAPGWLRGAQMNGSTDTWDADGDKVLDDGRYAPVLSGDFAKDGTDTHSLTVCDETGCEGDGFYAVMVGCGPQGDGWNMLCSTALDSTENGVWVDTDGDGIPESEVGREGSRNAAHFRIADLEFQGYNAGNGSSESGARHREGNFNFIGDGSSDGYQVDHIAFHSSDHGHPSSVSNEIYWSIFADNKNAGTRDYFEIKNSYIVLNNKMVLNNDCAVDDPCGAQMSFHDNVVLVDKDDSGVTAGSFMVAYLKPIDVLEDGSKKRHLIYNNEFIIRDMGAGGTWNNRWAFDVQAMGNGSDQGQGELWFYGNLVRNTSDNETTIGMFWPAFCENGHRDYADSVGWSLYAFNNTFDGWDSSSSINMGADGLCGNANDPDKTETAVIRNNTYTHATYELSTEGDPDTTVLEPNALDDSLRCTDYFACGTDPVTLPGLDYYRARTDGVLVGAGDCDPDADGVAGVDYDGDGVNDTTWQDLAGNWIDCGSLDDTFDLGAVQSGSAVVDTGDSGDTGTAAEPACATVELTSPSEGSLIETDAVFTWSSDCDAARLEVSTTSDFLTAETFYFGSFARASADISSKWAALDGMFQDGGYWRIVGGTGDGTTAVSAPRSFTVTDTGTPPSATTTGCSVGLDSPSNGATFDATTPPRFRWTTDCDGAVLEISGDPSFLLVDQISFGKFSSNPFSPPAAIWQSLAGSHFAGGGYWRVRGGGADGDHVSEVYSFAMGEDTGGAMTSSKGTASEPAVGEAHGTTATGCASVPARSLMALFVSVLALFRTRRRTRTF